MTKAELLTMIREMDPTERRELLAALRGSGSDGMADMDPAQQPSSGASDAMIAFDAAPSSPEGARALRLAYDELEPVVGRHVLAPAMDAARAYRLALDSLGVPTRGVHHDALPAIWRATVRQQRGGAASRNPTHGGTVRPNPSGAMDGINGPSNLPASMQRVLAGVRSLG